MWDQIAQASRLVDYDGACKFLGGVSRSHLKRAVARGHLRSVKLGARTMFEVDELIRYIASRRAAAKISA